jgi:beta-phosphoglucomutase-like phosphatase (HAD superfamily)
MSTGILFDFNGVIVDDEPQHCEALITTLAEYGHPLDRDTYYRDYLGFDDRECFRFSFARAGVPLEDDRLRGDRAEERALQRVSAAARLVPGVAEFIESGVGRHQLAIVSTRSAGRSSVLELAGCVPTSPRSSPRRRDRLRWASTAPSGGGRPAAAW